MTARWLVHLTTVVALVSKVASDWDFRGFDFGGDEDSKLYSPYEKAFNDEYAPFEFGLGSFGLMSDTPRFARMTSYVDPVESRFARNKRKSDASVEDAEEDDEEGDEKSEGDGSVDDYADRYERFVSRHFRDRDDRRKKDERKGEGKDEGSEYDYRFDFSPSDDYERIKQESEAQSRQLAKDPKNCKAYEQDGMLCHVCRDAETDTTSESCAYATDPHHKKFAYVKQKNYNSSDPENVEPEQDPKAAEDEPEAERDIEEVEEDEASSGEAAQLKAHPQKKRAESVNDRPQRPPVVPTKKPVVHAKPGQYAATGGGYRYQPVDLRSNKERPQIQPQQQQQQQGGIVHPTYNEFYTHFFPSQEGDRSQRIQQQEPVSADEVYALKYQNKDDVAKVLAEFEARDWSNCKKGKKNELTCYTCTDKDGVKHEECMYVSESRQVSSKVLPTATTVLPGTTGTVPKPTKKSRRKKVTSEKKAVSPKLKNASAMSGKLIQLEPSEQATGTETGEPAPTHRGQERQTVKRTVSIKSYVDGPGKAATKEPLDGGERVVHYEHHITHVL